jgi:hypothetical protein
VLADEGADAVGEGRRAGEGVVVNAEQNDSRRGVSAPKLGSGGEAIHPWHAHVHDDNVRVKLLHQADGQIPASGLTDDGHIGFEGETHAETGQYVWIVVDEKKLDH